MHTFRTSQLVSVVLAVSLLTVVWPLIPSAPSMAQVASPRDVGTRLPERPRDPWVPTPPQPDGRAGGQVVHELGPYRSIQVNVNAEGENIVGDAANEPSIAVDPFAPSRMVIGWRQFDSVGSDFRQAGWGITRNGGRTWTFRGVLEAGVFRSDPVLEVDAGGNFYYQSLALVEPNNPNTSDVFCDVSRSTDGGETWAPPIFAFGGDYQWFVIDRTGGIGDGNIYHSWTACASPFSPAIFKRSVDGGQSFGANLGMQPSVSAGTLAVGPDGTLFIVGIEDLLSQCTFDENRFLIARSTDARNPGRIPSFDLVTDVPIGGRCAFGASSSPNPAGGLGRPWVVVSPDDPEVVYVLSSVDPPGADPLEVHFLRSSDGGATWSAPVRVNDDPPGTNAWQWFGTMSVAPSGRIDAIWNDTRNATSQRPPRTSELYYSFSEDGGGTWAGNIPVSPPYDHFLGYPQQDKLGDYYQTVSDNLGVHVAYAATFNREQDIYYLRIGSYDCNGNDLPDEGDITSGSGRSIDADGNDIPDECDLAAERASLVADFTVTPEAGIEPLEVEMEAAPSRAAPGHPIVSYQWDFGDGATGEGPLARHLYRALGAHRIRLRVEDDLGRRSVTGKTISVGFRAEDVSPWTSDDIGEAPTGGGARLEEDCLLVLGASALTGNGPGGRADRFHFVHQEVSGDFELTVHVTDWSAETSGSVLGLMVRETLDPDSPHASVTLRWLTNGFRHRFRTRVESGGTTSTTSHEIYEQPDHWLGIGRRGNEIRGTLSTDGENWLPADSVELPGPAGQVHVGVASWWRGDEPLPATLCDVSLVSTPVFLRGDCNADGTVNVADAGCSLNWMFGEADEPGCLAALNTNGDDDINIADPVALLNFLFGDGPVIRDPFPDCGPGTLSPDERIGCAKAPSCR